MDVPLPFPAPSTLVLRQQLAEAGDSVPELRGLIRGIIIEIEMGERCSFCALRPGSARFLALPVME